MIRLLEVRKTNDWVEMNVTITTIADKLEHKLSFTKPDGTIVDFDGSQNVDLTAGIWAAKTSEKLLTARAIALKGEATGSVDFDGSQAVSMNVSIRKNLANGVAPLDADVKVPIANLPISKSTRMPVSTDPDGLWFVITSDI